MDRLKKILADNLSEELKSITVSRPRNKDNPVKKMKVRPIMLKKELYFQLTSYRGTKVIHENLKKEMLIDVLFNILSEDYAQLDMETENMTAAALINRKGNVNLKIKNKDEKNKASDNSPRLMHNRSKNYILREGEPVDYLVDLGVMTAEGKIINSRYDKFRQINRFLEYIEDVTISLPEGREIQIIDFGCGKSYLTFAVYHYLSIIRGMDVRITGLDLKEDVIKKCNDLSWKYGYDKLRFICGDISGYEPDDGDRTVDMVITLHACDTATDYALYNAVRWNAGVILSVPCCQHEINGQIDSDFLKPVMKYGIIKERMSALITDGIRAEILTACGYDVRLLEFIDMEHTPKNIMIRAVRKSEKANDRIDPEAMPEGLREMLREMKISPALCRLIIKK
ncbi:MAG: SAM-dependent methyltransferase [Lachnospiraceae bacterium]|nr:SAM-dependent methyltransferase [Lachnospiraceae bacterium]